MNSLPEGGTLCPFCLGAALAPKDVTEVVLALGYPTGKWAHCLSYAGGRERLGIRKHRGCLVRGKTGPSLLRAEDQWSGEPAHLPEGPGGWTTGRPVLPLAEHLRRASPGFQEEPLAVGQVVVGTCL